MTTRHLCVIIARLLSPEVTKRSHSLMDRMPVCGIGDSGSIPGESTSTKMSTPVGVPFLFVLSQ